MPRVTLIHRDGRRHDLDVPDGWTFLDVARVHDIDIEGACEGNMACATCHVVVMPPWYDLLPEPGDEEEDMLDMAQGLTETSRLGCQITLTDTLDGMVVRLPDSGENR